MLFRSAGVSFVRISCKCTNSRQVIAITCATEILLRQLAERLKALPGRKVYGYLPADVKSMVNCIVDELAKDERIAQLYDLWYGQHEAVFSTYTNDMPERVALSENEAFRVIKNAVVAEAAKLNHQEQAQQSDAGDVALGALRLLGQLSRVIESKIDDSPKQVQVESKLRQEVARKKQEQGLR